MGCEIVSLRQASLAAVLVRGTRLIKLYIIKFGTLIYLPNIPLIVDHMPLRNGNIDIIFLIASATPSILA